MNEAVFFDWMGTLGRPAPDRHELLAQVIEELVISPSPQQLIKNIYMLESQVPAVTPTWW